MTKHMMYVAAVALMALGSGCQHHNLASNCGSCGDTIVGCDSCGSACGCGGGCECGSGGGCRSGNCQGCNAGRGGRGGQMAGCNGDGTCNGACGGGRCGGRLAGALHNGAPARVGTLPHGHDPTNIQPGPPSGTYAYPYYTMMGPRDFLNPNPPSIGR